MSRHLVPSTQPCPWGNGGPRAFTGDNDVNLHSVRAAATPDLRSLGYVEGQNLVMEWLIAEGKFERFLEIIRELLSIKADVIVPTVVPMTRAAKAVTRTVPIVMASVANPVEGPTSWGVAGAMIQ
jgi:ABC-type uncharacterized transport system substrate-binding protein